MLGKLFKKKKPAEGEQGGSAPPQVDPKQKKVTTKETAKPTKDAKDPKAAKKAAKKPAKKDQPPRDESKRRPKTPNHLIPKATPGLKHPEALRISSHEIVVRPPVRITDKGSRVRKMKVEIRNPKTGKLLDEFKTRGIANTVITASDQRSYVITMIAVDNEGNKSRKVVTIPANEKKLKRRQERRNRNRPARPNAESSPSISHASLVNVGGLRAHPYAQSQQSIYSLSSASLRSSSTYRTSTRNIPTAFRLQSLPEEDFDDLEFGNAIDSLVGADPEVLAAAGINVSHAISFKSMSSFGSMSTFQPGDEDEYDYDAGHADLGFIGFKPTSSLPPANTSQKQYDSSDDNDDASIPDDESGGEEPHQTGKFQVPKAHVLEAPPGGMYDMDSSQPNDDNLANMSDDVLVAAGLGVPNKNKQFSPEFGQSVTDDIAEDELNSSGDDAVKYTHAYPTAAVDDDEDDPKKASKSKTTHNEDDDYPKKQHQHHGKSHDDDARPSKTNVGAAATEEPAQVDCIIDNSDDDDDDDYDDDDDDADDDFDDAEVMQVRARLPAPWTAYRDDDSMQIYYYNQDTEASQWDPPPMLEDKAMPSGNKIFVPAASLNSCIPLPTSSDNLSSAGSFRQVYVPTPVLHELGIREAVPITSTDNTPLSAVLVDPQTILASTTEASKLNSTPVFLPQAVEPTRTVPGLQRAHMSAVFLPVAKLQSANPTTVEDHHHKHRHKKATVFIPVKDEAGEFGVVDADACMLVADTNLAEATITLSDLKDSTLDPGPGRVAVYLPCIGNTPCTKNDSGAANTQNATAASDPSNLSMPSSVYVDEELLKEAFTELAAHRLPSRKIEGLRRIFVATGDLETLGVSIDDTLLVGGSLENPDEKFCPLYVPAEKLVNSSLVPNKRRTSLAYIPSEVRPVVTGTTQPSKSMASVFVPPSAVQQMTPAAKTATNPRSSTEVFIPTNAASSPESDSPTISAQAADPSRAARRDKELDLSKRNIPTEVLQKLGTLFPTKENTMEIFLPTSCPPTLADNREPDNTQFQKVYIPRSAVEKGASAAATGGAVSVFTDSDSLDALNIPTAKGNGCKFTVGALDSDAAGAADGTASTSQQNIPTAKTVSALQLDAATINSGRKRRTSASDVCIYIPTSSKAFPQATPTAADSNSKLPPPVQDHEFEEMFIPTSVIPRMITHAVQIKKGTKLGSTHSVYVPTSTLNHFGVTPELENTIREQGGRGRDLSSVCLTDEDFNLLRRLDRTVQADRNKYTEIYIPRANAPSDITAFYLPMEALKGAMTARQMEESQSSGSQTARMAAVLVPTAQLATQGIDSDVVGNISEQDLSLAYVDCDVLKTARRRPSTTAAAASAATVFIPTMVVRRQNTASGVFQAQMILE